MTPSKPARPWLPMVAWGLPLIVGAASGLWLAAGQPTALQGQQSRARDDIRALRTGLLTADGMPVTQEGLAALVQRGVPLDPWGRRYVYRNPGGPGHDFELFSLGPDGLESGDDIVHWNLYGGR